MPADPGTVVQALAPNLRGVQNAYNAGVHKISIPVSVSVGHSLANLNRKPEQSIEMMREVMAWMKAQPRTVPVVAGASTAFGCSIDGVVTTAQTVALCKGLADAGVDEIMLADTVGYGHPAQIREVVRATREAIAVTRSMGCIFPARHSAGSGSPTLLPGLRKGSAHSTHVSRGSGDVHMRRARLATSSPRTWCSCWKAWASRRGSISRS